MNTESLRSVQREISEQFTVQGDKISSDGEVGATHLCVLVHGLWGSPKHLSYMADALRKKHAEDKLHILVAKTNRDNLTYDGIDVGGERLAQEIEQYVEHLQEEGKSVKRFSIIGYSLGGLFSRYAIGLLDQKGFFDKIEPVNFHTFATPHLGVRTPILGPHSRLWNLIGSSSISVSGRQLFTMDKFRDTGRPLLAVLADPQSIFIKALHLFPNRVLYANCINDRSAPYYTTSISRTDPFKSLDSIKINYIPDYSPNILDLKRPVVPLSEDDRPPFLTRCVNTTRTLISIAPFFGFFITIFPIASMVFFVNSGIQSVRSKQRIRMHEEGKAGILMGSYQLPLLMQNVEEAKEAMQGAVQDLTLSRKPTINSNKASQKQANGHAEPVGTTSSKDFDYHRDQMNQIEGFTELGLTEDQFAMIDALDEVGFKKWRVHIHNVQHSHAAIVVRMKRKSFDEGRLVIDHWLEHEFVL